MTEDAQAKDANLEAEKHALEVEKFAFEKQKHELEKLSKAIEWREVQNTTVSQLLSVVKYLNELQDDKVTVVEDAFQRTTIKLPAREWNPHEEDIANASLMSLTRLIRSIGTECK